MANLKDLANLITNQDDKPMVLSTGDSHSQEDADLERQLRELRSKQELRKDWILFIVKDIVVFCTSVVFMFVVSGYALFTLLTDNSYNGEKKFATLVALLITACVSFAIGRATATRN